MDSAGKKLGSEYFVYNVEAIYGKLLSQFLGHSTLRKQVSLLSSLRLGHFTGERRGETAIFAGYGHSETSLFSLTFPRQTKRGEDN